MKALKTYIYPQNLKAKPHLWLWGLRDFVILALCVLLSLVLLVHSGFLLPLALTLCFAFMTIRMEDTTVISRWILGFPLRATTISSDRDTGTVGLIPMYWIRRWMRVWLWPSRGCAEGCGCGRRSGDEWQTEAPEKAAWGRLPL